MGITGLLQLLAPVTQPAHVQVLRGKRVAVDTYAWIHRGVYACAMELAQGTATNVFVDFCMRRVALLQHHNVTPVMVFDGCYLPSKQGKEAERSQYACAAPAAAPSSC